MLLSSIADMISREFRAGQTRNHNKPETGNMALEKNENYFELTDESDRASAIEAQFNEDALEQARRKIAPETSPDFDGLHCIDCGEKIMAARLKLGKIRCIDCQTLKEKQSRVFG
jgi:RNA polymerase-binding transcription factor DksA